MINLVFMAIGGVVGFFAAAILIIGNSDKGDD